MIKVSVKLEKPCRLESFRVYVNGTLLTERPNERYANLKAQAFAERLKAEGHNVELELFVPKKVA